MKRFFILLSLLLLPSLSEGADPWGDRLRTLFPTAKMIETNDDIIDWAPPVYTGHNVTPSSMPRKTNGEQASYNYYSQYGAPPYAYIKDHGVGNSITGKSVALTWAGNGGINHLGRYFGDGTPQSGYGSGTSSKSLHFFYRIKVPKRAWPTDKVGDMGRYLTDDPSNGYVSAVPKIGAYSNGLTDSWHWNYVLMQSQPNIPRMPYGMYAFVPHLQSYGMGVTPADPLNRSLVLTTQNSDQSNGTWPGSQGYEMPSTEQRDNLLANAGGTQLFPTDVWVGLEYVIKLNDTAKGRDALDIWFYPPNSVDGSDRVLLYSRTNMYMHNVGISSGHAWNQIFVGGNSSGGWLTIDGTMAPCWFVDDMIIYDEEIGPIYYVALSQFLGQTPIITSASPVGGTFTNAQNVILTSTGTTIYYTTNGSTPTTSSLVYTGPITIGTTTTLKYFATKAGESNEAVKTQVYTINIPPLPITTVYPLGGTYYESRLITLTSTGDNIYYTTNGSTPTNSSTKYTGPISIGATTTLKFFATGVGGSEAVQTHTYTITTPPATIGELKVRKGSNGRLTGAFK